MSSSTFTYHLWFYSMDTVWPFISTSPNCLAAVWHRWTRQKTCHNGRLSLWVSFSLQLLWEPTAHTGQARASCFLPLLLDGDHLLISNRSVFLTVPT